MTLFAFVAVALAIFAVGLLSGALLVVVHEREPDRWRELADRERRRHPSRPI